MPDAPLGSVLATAGVDDEANGQVGQFEAPFKR